MINKAKAIPNEEARQKMTVGIANFMKMAYLTWNKDSVSDDLIIEDLRTLSKGELQLPADTVLTKLDFKTPPPGSRVKTAGNTNNNNNNNNNSQYKSKHQGNNNNNNKLKNNKLNIKRKK